MARQSAQKETSVGICRFCKETFAKGKMTQHLKTCKARLAEKQDGQTERLFHLFVEGSYRPSYWMHLELPASATLLDLDDFLRDTWLECCGHLSEFTIKGASYSSVSEDEWDGGFSLLGEEEEEPGVNGGSEQATPSAEAMASQIAESLSAELHADLKDVSITQIEEKLAEMLSENMPPGAPSLSSPEFRPFLNYMATALKEGTLADQIEEMEDLEESEMDVTLEEVLSVGEQFSYVYDFGSSTNLSFKVIAEREGVIPAQLIEELEDEEEDEELEDEEEDEDEAFAIVVMARNEPPPWACHLCGKPATHVLPESEYDTFDKAGLCDEHAKKHEYSDELLPMVNSPRVGVCGYTGEVEDDWEEWDEEEGDDEE